MKPRSLKQLRYTHGVVIRDLMEWNEAHGDKVPPEKIKELAYIAVGHCETKVVFGEPRLVRKNTPSSMQELEELMEAIRAWAAGFGCEILLPREGIDYPVWREL